MFWVPCQFQKKTCYFVQYPVYGSFIYVDFPPIIYTYTISFEETNVDSQAGQKQNAGRDRPFYLFQSSAPEAWSFFKLLDSEPLAETGFRSFGKGGAFRRAGAGGLNAGLTVGGCFPVELMMGWLVGCFFVFLFFPGW